MDCGFYCCRSTTAWRGDCICGENKQSEYGKGVSVSDMSGGGGWSDNSLSGNITSDVSQNIYLADSQKVKKIYVKEGDTVKVGDDLLTYDMTLENLDLEMKKLEKQGIELNIELSLIHI